QTKETAGGRGGRSTLPKLRTRVRFSSPALHKGAGQEPLPRAPASRLGHIHRAFIARATGLPCADPVHDGHRGPDSWLTVSGRGPGSWATRTPVPALHGVVRLRAVATFFAVGCSRSQIRGRPSMLVELGLVEQRHQALLEVLDDGASIVDVARRYGVARQTLH